MLEQAAAARLPVCPLVLRRTSFSTPARSCIFMKVVFPKRYASWLPESNPNQESLQQFFNAGNSRLGLLLARLARCGHGTGFSAGALFSAFLEVLCLHQALRGVNS